VEFPGVDTSRRSFFALGRLEALAFRGELNPLSSCSIYETCIVPTLLYSCETWLLDSTSLKELESFQHEIGCRILKVPKFYSAAAVRIGLHWPNVSTRVLIRKLKYLSKLLSSEKDILSTRRFNSVAMEDVYNCSIVQQSRVLEAELGTNVLALCLNDPVNATQTVLNNKEQLLKKDFSNYNLLLSAKGSAHLATSIASKVS